MGVVCLLYKIRKMHKLDNQRVYSLLSKEVDTKELMKNIVDHIRRGECYKLQNDSTGEVLGVFLAKKYKKHYSLTYYFLKDEVRRKPISLIFFMRCMSKLNPLFSVYVKKNKNYSTYSRYFEETEDSEILRFKGLRDSSFDDKFKEVINGWSC
ncbi:hypothetical protein [Aliarcobacter butzleri]|uniref:hypothetical protein n=1 Tax=Aliarcobacter butzleri TaxID=28197 RepID=UPI00125F8988|nr:hypothetical protein [Aliarcobacter butzleri]